MFGEHESAGRQHVRHVGATFRHVGGGPLDQLCEALGPERVVIVDGDEVYSCDARRFAEERAS